MLRANTKRPNILIATEIFMFHTKLFQQNFIGYTSSSLPSFLKFSFYSKHNNAGHNPGSKNLIGSVFYIVSDCNFLKWHTAWGVFPLGTISYKVFGFQSSSNQQNFH